jgi:hypothetical protein
VVLYTSRRFRRLKIDPLVVVVGADMMATFQCVGNQYLGNATIAHDFDLGTNVVDINYFRASRL